MRNALAPYRQQQSSFTLPKQCELVDFDLEVQEIREVIEHTSEETQQKIDWTQLWNSENAG